MLDKLKEFKQQYDEIEQQMSDPEIIADRKRFIKLHKDYKDLQPLVEAYHEYEELLSNIESAKEIIHNDWEI